MTEAASLEGMWRESVRKDRERRRRTNRAAWYCYLMALAESHRAISESFERRALALLEDEGGSGA